jgi:hypothetical protein
MAAAHPTEKPATKQCRQCSRVLPFDRDHFWVSNQHPFGLRARCRQCVLPGRRVYGRQGLQKVRLQVLTHYSQGTPACACCGETVVEFLSLDHLFGSSQADYRLYGNSDRLFRNIRRQGFPPVFRVLCHNCNQCHRIYGYCVHRPPISTTEHFPLYTKEWRLVPTILGDVRCGQCIHCLRSFPRTIEFFPAHRMMGDGLLNACRDCYRHNQTEHARHRNTRQKRQVFEHYSQGTPRCACCGLTTFEFLSIDHVHGGGAKHRRELKGSSVYSWLVKSYLPVGFQVLCFCCNQAKGYYGRCPHTR